MMKKFQKDIAEKTLESYNDVFADIVNVLLFKGNRLVDENDLVDAESASSYKLSENLHEQKRDVAKFWKNGKIRLCLYGFENQTKIDPWMPLRIINYDGANYRAQIGQKHRAYPVVTMVLYFGERRWKKRNLLECLEFPEELKDYVSDYKINVFEIPWLDLEQVNMFQSDFKIVADFFVQKRLYKNYNPSKDIVKHVDEVLQMMYALTGDRLYEMTQQEYHRLEQKGGRTMDLFLSNLFNERLKKEVAIEVKKEVAKIVDTEVAKKVDTEVAKIVDIEVAKIVDTEVAKIVDIEVAKKVEIEVSKERSRALAQGIAFTTKNLIRMNMVDSQIAEATGLSFEKINELREEVKKETACS